MPSPSVLWFAAFALCLAAETMLPVGVLLFAGLGALAAWLAALLGASLSVQALVFCAATVLSALLLRSRLRRALRGKRNASEPPASVPAGTVGRVTRDIRPGAEGQVAVLGSYWRAAAKAPVCAGTEVRVTGSAPDDLLLLTVEALESPAPDEGR